MNRLGVPLLIATGLLWSATIVRTEEPDKPKKSAAEALAEAARVPLNFDADIVPLLKQHCFRCHGERRQRAGLSLTKFKNEQSILEGRKTWVRVAQMIRSGEMPPPNAEEQPTDEQRTLLADWIETVVNKIDCTGTFDPGRVTIRRLNRLEYNNTVHDLVGVDFQPAADFPSDDVGYGFDNIGDVLSLPPVLFEKYLAAAEKITETAIAARSLAGDFAEYSSEQLQGGSRNGDRGASTLGSNGTISAEHNFATAGTYMIRVRAFENHAGDEYSKAGVQVGDKAVDIALVTGTSKKPSTFSWKVDLPAGQQKIGVSFLNDYYKPDDPNPENRDRNLHVLAIEVQGPLMPQEPLAKTALQDRLLPRLPKPDLSDARECAEADLAPFIKRAFRRPVEREELDRYVDLAESVWQEGESFERAMQIALQSVLVSPHFLFRIEQDQEPDNPQAIHPITDHELATRLSYFLWSTMPDDELLALADQHALRNGDTLDQQVQRMLKDPRSRNLIENFSGQWLQLRLLKTFQPDPKLFPGFDDALREAMQKETELFFNALVREDRSLLDLIDGDFTFVNQRLAEHYGMPGIKGEEFQRVKLDGMQRGGILSQASILTVTSNPTRTSPVKRGKWVLENILGTPPPPPPPNVPELDAQTKLTGTLRQRMQQHRENPACANCHEQMDALGFGLENFNAIGAWRETDGEARIDASGTLPSGESFQTPQELRSILRHRQGEVARCLTEKMLTYALGRGLEYYDKCVLDQIEQQLQAHQYKMSTLIQAIVHSDPFQKRRGKRGDQ